MAKFTDLYVNRDSDGIYDFVIEDGDLKKTAGMDSAIFVSLFTDRRANPDEVGDPMKRRGWCGTQNTPDRQGNRGSGIWLYEQRRLTPETTEGVRMEAHQSLYWMVTDRLAKQFEIEANPAPENRSLVINIRAFASSGGVTDHSYSLWDATPQRTLRR